MEKSLVPLLLLLCSFSLSAQLTLRWPGENDSTEYNIPGGGQITIGAQTVYENTNGQLTTIKTFNLDPATEYIRDFDAISSTKWYLVTGSKFIGGDSKLHLTLDGGQSWREDTSFYKATRPAENNGTIANYKSISQLQAFSSDSLLISVSYYQTGTFYSVDGGSTWSEWFTNTPSHYQLILPCDTAYFLFSMEGDAISPYLFSFPKDQLFSSNNNGEWSQGAGVFHPNCFALDDPECIEAKGATGYQQFQYAYKYVDSVCGVVSPVLKVDLTALKKVVNTSIFPEKAVLQSTHSFEIYTARVIGIDGKEFKLRTSKSPNTSHEIALPHTLKGVSWLQVETSLGVVNELILRQ